MIKYPKLSDMTPMGKVQLPLFPSYSNPLSHNRDTRTTPRQAVHFLFCILLFFFSYFTGGPQIVSLYKKSKN